MQKEPIPDFENPLPTDRLEMVTVWDLASSLQMTANHNRAEAIASRFRADKMEDRLAELEAYRTDSRRTVSNWMFRFVLSMLDRNRKCNWFYRLLDW